MSRAYNPPALPAGAVKVDPPVLIKVSSWVPQHVDAYYDCVGIKWARVVGGFGDHGDREDWIAVLPGVSMNVSRYRNEPWRGTEGENATMDDAIYAAMRSAVRYAKDRRRKAQDEVDGYSTQIRLLTKALIA